MRSEALRGLLLRKSLHVSLSLLLLAPLVAGFESYEVYYAALLVAASLIYAAQVRRPLIVGRIRRYVEEYAASVTRLVPTVEQLREFLESVVRLAEREYERRWGFLGVLLGAASVYIVATLGSREALLVAILSLVVYDSVSALCGVLVGRRRWPLSHVTVEGSVCGGAAFSASIMLLLGDPLTAALAPLAAALAEAYGVEDNFSMPLATAAVHDLAPLLA